MLKKILSMALVAVMCLMLFVGCGLDGGCELPDFSFEGRCVMTEDGFLYYDDTKYGGSKGLCIIDLPDTEEVVIPEYIDGKRVNQLGYKHNSLYDGKEYTINFGRIKKLTIQHDMDWYSVSGTPKETVEYVDLPYCYINSKSTSIRISNVGGSGPRNNNVILTKSDRELDLTGFSATVIEIPLYVTHIDAGVFSGLSNVIIKTAYDSKPEGWAEGWNGDCEVQWGVDMYSLIFERLCQTTEDGFVYYDDTRYGGSQGLCIIKLPDTEEVVIPKYIDGKRVAQLGYKDNGLGYAVDYAANLGHIKKLTIQHDMDWYSVSGSPIETVEYVDYPYCVIDATATIRISNKPGWSGLSNANVILTKSNRKLDLTGFSATVIEIPMYVTQIDAGVFGGLSNVTIKTAYDFKPEGWAEGWNGDCEVQWGVELSY